MNFKLFCGTLFLFILSACMDSTEPTSTSTTAGDGQIQVTEGSAQVAVLLSGSSTLSEVNLCLGWVDFQNNTDHVARRVSFPQPLPLALNHNLLSQRIVLAGALSIHRQVDLTASMEAIYLGLSTGCAGGYSILAYGQSEDVVSSQEPHNLLYSTIIHRGGLEEPSQYSKTEMFFDISQLITGLEQSLGQSQNLANILSLFDGLFYWRWN